MGMKMSKLLIVITDTEHYRKEFENEVQRNRYVDRVILPQYKFSDMPPVIMKIGDLLFVGDEYPNEGDLA
jgi:hypothetical protein